MACISAVECEREHAMIISSKRKNKKKKSQNLSSGNHNFIHGTGLDHTHTLNTNCSLGFRKKSNNIECIGKVHTFLFEKIITHDLQHVKQF